MPTNDFKTFASAGGANVVSQAAYEALTTLIANGFSTGTANSSQLNKVWRQSSILAAVLAQFIVDNSGANAVDDGTTATLLLNLKAAVSSGAVLGRIATAGGTVDALTAVFTPPPLSVADGVPYYVLASGANVNVAPTFTPNSGTITARTIVKENGSPLSPGDIVAGHWLQLQYRASTTAWVLANPRGAQLNLAQTFTKAQRGAVIDLASTAGSIAVDLALANNYKHTLTENTVLAAPTNAVEGQSGYLFLQQHATAAKTLAYNTFWKFSNGTIPTLTTTLGAFDMLVYSVDPGGATATCQLLKDRK